jgi:hypothetical protein
MACLHSEPLGLEEGHVLSVSPCSSCQARADLLDPVWKWGRCMTPDWEDAKLIAAAPELQRSCRELIAEIAALVEDGTLKAENVKNNEAVARATALLLRIQGQPEQEQELEEI